MTSLPAVCSSVHPQCIPFWQSLCRKHHVPYSAHKLTGPEQPPLSFFCLMLLTWTEPSPGHALNLPQTPHRGESGKGSGWCLFMPSGLYIFFHDIFILLSIKKKKTKKHGDGFYSHRWIQFFYCLHSTLNSASGSFSLKKVQANRSDISSFLPT